MPTITAPMLEAERRRKEGKSYNHDDYQALKAARKRSRRKSGQRHSSDSGDKKKPKKK